MLTEGGAGSSREYMRCSGSDLAHPMLVSSRTLRELMPGMDDTATAYSSFCSNLPFEQYEKRLVQATSASQGAKAKYSIEKRYGQTREDYEQQLVGLPAA